MNVAIRSPLAPDALMERMRAATDPESGWSGTGPDDVKKFRGTLVGRAVSVRLRGRSWMRPAYGPEFNGAVEADAAGSLLRGAIRTDHWTRGMMWFAAIFGLCMVGVFAILLFIPGFEPELQGPAARMRGMGAIVLVALQGAALAALAILPQRLRRERLHRTLRRVAGSTGSAD